MTYYYSSKVNLQRQTAVPVGLTNVTLVAGNRATRMKINVDKLTFASAGAKTTKCADLIDNTATIVKYDQKFARVYLREKQQTLEAIQHGADPALWNRAWNQCQREISKCKTSK